MKNIKHAYLIMAHNQPELLKRLILALDDERNDIYIHIDKKWKDFSCDKYEQLIKKANIYWSRRTNVKWGAYSQIKCEMLLLKEAIKKKHAYYHLLSGVDIPLKSQNEIHDFFLEYNGLEFIDEDNVVIDERHLDRIKYYHILCDNRGNHIIHNKFISIQKKFGINRLEQHSQICYQKGRNWFSITHDFAKYVIAREKWIKSMFKYSLCGDELFLQTVIRNSEFKDKICNNNTMPQVADTRYIDWERGTPYVFRKIDYMNLTNSSALFARKFDYSIDNEIIEMLFFYLKGK